ncbi:MAG: hypothetical protein ACI4VP_06190 [Clostridia bacterium]
MIDKNKERLLLINRLRKAVIAFSKGYTSDNEELLAKKIQFAKNGLFDFMSTLDIIPQHLSMSGEDIFYKLANGNTAAKIDFKMHYYDLLTSSFEERQKIAENIAKQRHHLEHLKNKVHSSNGHMHVLEQEYGKREKIERKCVTAQSKEELIIRVKQSIWDLLKEDESKSSIPIEFNLHHIDFFQTPDGFEAEYDYTLYEARKSPNHPSHPRSTSNSDDGRNE